MGWKTVETERRANYLHHRIIRYVNESKRPRCAVYAVYARKTNCAPVYSSAIKNNVVFRSHDRTIQATLTAEFLHGST